jgi:hypothetical protein
MKLAQRQPVEGTEPHIYIGRRVNRNRGTCELVESSRWWAEYCMHGRQKQEPLGTGNKQRAIQKAGEIQRRLTAGQPHIVSPRTTLKDIVEGYIEFQKTRGRAPKTIEKYQ